ncbi:MAG TPA: polyphosphate kinase 1 [Spirochaetia bacterium]|nr:MAG: hypothetical protein A2Y41_07075 [Spirochaetes bacterium GWB1_36_13]HCL55803.1 polyphosphate kinase 1 [Spirochaetia bacterium]
MKGYLNRELSWLAFNERVLEEAENPKNPVLERLKFLSIYSSNLDEFFMVRVAGLQDQVDLGYEASDPSGLNARAQIEAISKKVHELKKRLYHQWEEIKQFLSEKGFFFQNIKDAQAGLQEYLKKWFENQILPVITPMAIDPTHPFPFIYNKTLNILLVLNAGSGEKKYAILPVPGILPRYFYIQWEKKHFFFFIEDLISFFAPVFFNGYLVESSYVFRITRNGDLSVDEEEAEDLLKEIETQLKERRKGAVVRLAVTHSAKHEVLKILSDRLEIDEKDIYFIDGPLDLTFGFKLYDDLAKFMPEEIYPAFKPYYKSHENIFEVLKKKEILLHHPYESFEPVIDFLKAAAEDPLVLAIKQTLYRSSGENSKVVSELVKAAGNNKQVTVLLELRARFDEEKNISWAKKLEEAGCHVIYGLKDYKTHAKALLVVRKEPNGTIKRYMHLGTGNYNEKTASVYTDLSFFSSNDDLALDMSSFFNFLTGYSIEPEWKKISIAPKGLKKKIISLIENEMRTHTPNNPGRIIAKMNSLVHPEIIEKLYEASCKGVEIDLIIRGICCLSAGVEGLSENIKVRSIVGRFLEHSRIFYFKNAGDERFFLSSADWMPRNLEKRIELMFPVENAELKEKLMKILLLNLKDNQQARIQSNGFYLKPKPDSKKINAQEKLIQMGE